MPPFYTPIQETQTRPQDLNTSPTEGNLTEAQDIKQTRQRKRKRSDNPDRYEEDSVEVIDISDDEDQKKIEKPKLAKRSQQRRSQDKPVTLQTRNSTAQTRKAETKTALKQKATALRKENKELVHENRRLVAALNDNDMMIQQLQKTVIGQLAKYGSTIDDETLRTKIDKAMKLHKQWAKSFAIDTLEGMEAAALRNIELYISRRWTESAADKNTGLLSPQMAQTAPTMLLNAILSRFVAERFLERPFWFLDQTIPGSQNNVELGVMAVFDYMRERNEARANGFRSEVVQGFLSRNFQYPQQYDDEPFARMQESTAELYEDSVDSFFEFHIFQSLLKGLDEEGKSKRRADLLNVMTEAGELSSALWTQKADVIIEYKEFLGKRFDYQDKKYVAHGSLKLATGDKSQNGQKISFVLEPGIYIAGTEEGAYMNRKKTMYPAVVWFAKRECDGRAGL